MKILPIKPIRAAWRWIQCLVRWLFPHKHNWTPTGTNGFYMPTEEMCWECGEYRHRVLKADDLPDVAEWEEGKHPMSESNAKGDSQSPDQ